MSESDSMSSFFTAHLYGQLDSRWSSQLLGFSKTTIGKSGCAITAVGNLHNLIFGTDFTPSEVNTRLKAVKAFSGALILWARVPLAFPQLKFVSRDWNYNNAVVWSFINVSPKLPIIIDVKPRLIPQHFVVFIGEKKLVDSLDGKIKPTSTYLTLRGSVRFIKG